LRDAGGLTAAELQQPGRFADAAALNRLLPPADAAPTQPSASGASDGHADEL
jgi:hypothetical protein